MTVKLLTLDLDDTLWHAKPILLNAERLVIQFFTSHCPTLLEVFDHKALIDKRIAVYKSRPDLRHQISQLRIEAVRQALLEAGYGEQDASDYANQAFKIFIDARHQIDYFPDTFEVLEVLSKRFTLAALTNGNADVQRLEIAKFFDISATAEQINASKPAPDHFQFAMQEANVCSAETIHIGDHAEHDILGAQQLNIATIWVNTKGKHWDTNQELPSASISALSELPDAVDLVALNC